MKEIKTINGIAWDVIRSEDMTHFRAKQEGNPHFPVMANIGAFPVFNFDIMSESGMTISFDEGLLNHLFNMLPEEVRNQQEDANDKEGSFLRIASHFIETYFPLP